MPIAGASTTIAPSKTAAEVSVMLTKAGANQIMSTYENGEPVGLAFTILTKHGERAFRLPIRPDGVRLALKRDGVIPSRQTPEHALRVAWRIARDWLRAQLAIIDAGLVTLDEIMLPYAIVGQQTMYEAVHEHGLRGAIER